ncbi:hypothetical protein [Sphingobium sp. BHU LFT2]|uniref:hypothetical protein n=1 Tax=Sphingobium sp. BHU LFT2 TaxID=2807634 RepID=UPI003337FE08
MILERWFSDGVLGNQYVVCQPGSCRESANNHPTIDQNFMPGAFYMDIGGNYNITPQVTAYFKVDNLFDRDPAKSPYFVNPNLYDVIGCMYRAGVRVKF